MHRFLLSSSEILLWLHPSAVLVECHYRRSSLKPGIWPNGAFSLRLVVGVSLFSLCPGQMSKSPFSDFFQRGLNVGDLEFGREIKLGNLPVDRVAQVTLSTDDPLMFHTTKVMGWLKSEGVVMNSDEF